MPLASVSKRVLVHNLSYENEFDLQRAGKTQFHMKGYAPGLVLKQRKRQLNPSPPPPPPSPEETGERDSRGDG